MTTLKEHLSRLGSKGGKARAKNLTKEQLSEIGRKAVEARWAKRMKRIDASLRESARIGEQNDAAIEKLNAKVVGIAEGTKRLEKIAAKKAQARKRKAEK